MTVAIRGQPLLDLRASRFFNTRGGHRAEVRWWDVFNALNLLIDEWGAGAVGWGPPADAA